MRHPSTFLPPSRRSTLCCALAGLTLATAGCSSFGPEPKGVRPDPAAIRKIGVVVEPENLGVASDSKLLGEMAGRIAGNLGTWHFPVAAKAAGQTFTHILEGRVQAMTHKSTPGGFSLTMGNSDPRALDFQKADVVPVDCYLYPVGKPRDRASLYMDFMATGPLKTAAPNVADADTRDILVEHISTVCFNLLDDLKAPRLQPAATAGAGGAVSAPSWMPEVRVEIRDRPADPLSLPKAPAAPAAPAVTSPAAPATAVPSPAAPARVPAAVPAPAPRTVPAAPATPTAPAPAAVPKPAAPAAGVPTAAPAPASAPATTPPVTTEVRPDPAEGGRKQMIIHNQGAPIILEFGYERK